MPHLHRRLLRTIAALTLLLTALPSPAQAQTTITVTSSADSGAGTLRAAITTANSTPGPNIISFAIPGAGPWTIRLARALPELSDGGTTIDGPLVSNRPQVVVLGSEILDNSGNLAGAAGLVITSANNTVRGLVLSGFGSVPGGDGGAINLHGANASGNIIERCYIGTNAAGDALGAVVDRNNASGGVVLSGGASGNTVRNNVISGNTGTGVLLDPLLRSGDITNNRIENNIIGLNAAGTAALSNLRNGVEISRIGDGNIIGPGNVISGNGDQGAIENGAGITLAATNDDTSTAPTNTRIIGNIIGLNAAGTAAIGNLNGGIRISGTTGTTIGGSGANEGNIIAGNNGNGVFLSQPNTNNRYPLNATILNNRIGVNGAGGDFGNTSDGVLLDRYVANVTIGPNNIIGGNTRHGVQLVGSQNGNANIFTTNNTITGNLIGTSDGTQLVGNDGVGVVLVYGANNNTIADNTIVGNTTRGVYLTSASGQRAPSGNTIRGNRIGLTSNATPGNGGSGGILLEFGSSNNTIGPLNVISGHVDPTRGYGVGLFDPTTNGNTIIGNTLSGNTIGVLVSDGASGNTIGGSGAGNVISGNGTGISVRGAGTDATQIIENRVTNSNSNGTPGHGITVRDGAQRTRISRTTTASNVGDGITVSAANANITAPQVSALAFSNGTLSGSISSPATCSGPGCVVEVFDSDSQQDREGPTYLATFNTGGSGAFSVALPARGCQPWLTFTITDANGNTSPFTNAQQVSGCTGTPPPPQLPQAELSAGTPSPQLIAPGGAAIVFTHTLRNIGTAAGVFTVSATGPAGWTVTVETGASGALEPQASREVRVRVQAPANAQPNDYQINVTAAVSGAPSVSQVDVARVQVQAGLTFTPASQRRDAGRGQEVCFDHTLTNTGDGPDTFALSVQQLPGGWATPRFPASVTLARGQSQVVQVCITVPQNAMVQDYAVVVRATSQAQSSVFADVTDTVGIIATAVPIISPAQTRTIDATRLVSFTHTITNAGDISGTFTVALTVPNGWQTVTAPATSVSLAPGQTASVSFSVRAPAGAVAGNYPLVLRATNQSNAQISSSVTDTAVVPGRGGVLLSADQQQVGQPASTSVYTLTVTNTGNITDTIALTAGSSRGWATQVTPGGVALAPNASAPVQVRVAVPAGSTAGISDTTTVTATSSVVGGPVVSDTALLTTTVAARPGLLWTPETRELRLPESRVLTFTYTLSNSGSVSETVNITTTGVPAGWQATFTTTTTATLAPGEGLPVALTVRAPAGASTGATITLVANAQSAAGNVSASATARVRIGPALDVLLSPDRTSEEAAGTLVRYTHYLTNTGSRTETFRLSAISALGWDTSIAPSSVELPPDGSTTVVVTVQVPRNAAATEPPSVFGDGDQPHILYVRAAAASDPTVRGEVIDRTFVAKYAGASLSPSRAAQPEAGRTLRFEHTLVNTGNGRDTFTFTYTQELNWPVTVTPAGPLTLNRGAGFPVIVTVQVPFGTPPNAINRITVTAESQFNPTVRSSIVDLIAPLTVQESPLPTGTRIYLPVLYR